MSNRREQYGTSVPSPVVRYYEWKSDQKKFGYYDKTKGENIFVLPLKVAILTTRACVRGWHDSTESSIFSNEVKNSGQETMNVYSSKPDKSGNTLIATGLYRDIKANLGGGHYEKSVYAYEQGVGIVKLNFKGAALMAYSTFEKDAGKKTFDFLLEVKRFTEGKKGKVTYSTPVFELGSAIDTELDKEVNEAFDKVEEYFNSKTRKNDDQEEDLGLPTSMGGQPSYSTSNEPEPVEADGLPF